MKSLTRLNTYFLRYKYHLIFGTVFIILANIFSIVPGRVIRYALDYVIHSTELYFVLQTPSFRSSFYNEVVIALVWLGVILLVLALLKGVFMYFMRQTIIVMSRRIEYDLKSDIYYHYQTLPLSFYRKNNTGDLMARISEDVSRVRMYVGPAIMYSINLFFTCILTISYMFYIHPKLALFSLIPLPILSVSVYIVNGLINKRSEEIQQSLSRLSTFVQESFSGIRVLKSFVREDRFSDLFSKENDTYKQKSLRLNFVESLFSPAILVLVGLSTIVVVYIGGIEVMKGTITPGVIAEFIIYINLLTWPIVSLGSVISMIQRAAASQKRINEFLDIQTDIVSREHFKKMIDGSIVFDKVSLVYPESGIKTLNDISFSIKAGEIVAIVGPTGSGKSTLANLICRLYDATSGAIYIDGVDNRSYDVASLREQIGYVPQDVFLFSDTIRHTISFGFPEATEDAIIQAAKDADVYDTIVGFSHGLDTVIGERGITLSGGQKQRISIARAIIRKPRLLILDDCLSAVDTKTESVILHNLKKIMYDRTSLIISHRISSVKLANRILVIREGMVVEQGSHEDLLQLNGFYKELYEKQLRGEQIDI